MARRPDPPPTVDLVIDTSPEAQASYLEAIKFLLRYYEQHCVHNVDAGNSTHPVVA